MADSCGQIRVNDQIVEVDGQSLRGFNNHQAVEVLRSTGQVVKLRLARYLRGPKYDQLRLAMADNIPAVLKQSDAPTVVAAIRTISDNELYRAPDECRDEDDIVDDSEMPQVPVSVDKWYL